LSFEEAWNVVKADFGEKFNSKLDSLKEGGRPVPKRFADMKSTTGGEEHNRKVMADILETDNDGIEDEYRRLKDMFDREAPISYNLHDSSSQALGSKGLIERFKRAGPTPRGPVKKYDDTPIDDLTPSGQIRHAMNGPEDFVEEVRDLVEQGMPVMEAVQQVCRLVGCKGRDLMRAYTEAYR
jgi:hypothetical protein